MNEFIPYRFSIETDSTLCDILDSIKPEIIENHLYILIHFKRSYPNYNLTLSFIKDKNDFGGIVNKTNRFYVSSNKKYKIPIIFSDDDVFNSSQINTVLVEYFPSYAFPTVYPLFSIEEIYTKEIKRDIYYSNRKIPDFIKKPYSN